MHTAGPLGKRLVYPQTLGSKNFVIGIDFLGPGEEMREPKGHPFEEAYFVLEGKGQTMIKGEKSPVELEKYLSLYFPPWVGHETRNTGDGPLVILYVSAPPPTAKDIEAIKAQQ